MSQIADVTGSSRALCSSAMASNLIAMASNGLLLCAVLCGLVLLFVGRTRQTVATADPNSS